MKYLFSILGLALALNLFGQSCIGQWVTIDDNTGEKKSVVELYKKDGKLYGHIVYIFPRKGVEENPKCKECSGELKNKPITGMQIVKNLKWDGSAWEGGTILDPENGKTYTVKIWTENGDEKKLNVRGYIGPLYRTQTWVKATKEY
jgi:uncharacterized protein (DUF2147 family)